MDHLRAEKKEANELNDRLIRLELCLEISGNLFCFWIDSQIEFVFQKQNHQNLNQLTGKQDNIRQLTTCKNWLSLRYPNWFVMDLLEPRLQKYHRPDRLHREGDFLRISHLSLLPVKM